ncbi:choice-of-anchor L domain-containing protein [Simiduia curdlanivorans]|uniref:Choice-of-anchor L family PEP-CTERM protein n=1 Tax=Simiduia curdlanivorans TaxID=1492769 RepID=A0ABV8V7J6_9GAMM|nr:choice-of-anchor L domain-containing protein [Simiduia curdlanivorans]MDN3639019.1 choice-of-anchor L domain-containing protein [Simiduia curdlanivorans]
MRRNALLALGLTSTAFFCHTASALVVTPQNDGAMLAGDIVGSGISVSNINYVGANGASGFFTDGLSSGLGFDTGVLLTTGNAAGAAGPNTATDFGSNNGLSGDADLSALSGYSTFDATTLSFDFEFDGGLGGDLYFNFIFASEEYNEYVNSEFNDIFALYVDGVNVALLPDLTPIAINNVNNGSNAGYYNDNESGTYNLQYDGFTNAFNVALKGMSSGVHSMKFAIADGSDYILDSGIFIQASSFSTTPVDVPEPGSLLLLSFGLIGLGMARRHTNKAE